MVQKSPITFWNGPRQIPWEASQTWPLMLCYLESWQYCCTKCSRCDNNTKSCKKPRKLSRCAKVVSRASLLVLYDENKWDDFVRAPCPFSRAISPKAFSSWFWVRIFKIIPNCCISRILWLQFHAGWSASYLRGDKISQRLEVYFTRIGGGDLIRGKNL